MSWNKPPDVASRRCPSCGFLVNPPDPWYEDNATPIPAFCPSCGVALERMACRACDAPLVLRHDRSGRIEPAPHCMFCGAETRLREPRMRRRPRRKKKAVDSAERRHVLPPLTDAQARRLLRAIFDKQDHELMQLIDPNPKPEEPNDDDADDGA